MRTLAILALAVSTFAVPVSPSHAGFWTDVAKGSVKNAARQAKMSAGRIAGGATRAAVGGVCALKAAAGRQC